MGQPVVHFEIVGADGDALRRFYAALFGWEFDADNGANHGLVRREDNTTADGVGIGGSVGVAPVGVPGHVTFYVEVPDVAAALTVVERLGGSRLYGPDRVSDGLEFGVFTDPEGHLIGLVHHAGSGEGGGELGA